eukprot:356730-Chlamydomonas_euryale.AAC.4
MDRSWKGWASPGRRVWTGLLCEEQSRPVWIEGLVALTTTRKLHTTQSQSHHQALPSPPSPPPPGSSTRKLRRRRPEPCSACDAVCRCGAYAASWPSSRVGKRPS